MSEVAERLISKYINNNHMIRFAEAMPRGFVKDFKSIAGKVAKHGGKISWDKKQDKWKIDFGSDLKYQAFAKDTGVENSSEYAWDENGILWLDSPVA